MLVVDDNATNRDVLRIQLASWGIIPVEAADGPAALQSLKQSLDAGNHFRLAILDMQMPGMDGVTLARTIRADARLKSIALVMMTSLGRHDDPHLLDEVGFVAWLTKPVRESRLLDCLATALGKEIHHNEAKTAISGLPQPARASRRARILLAEDNITNQQVAVGILSKMGYRVDAVANGEEALQALASLPYDLVLMDVQMPVMDGLEATRQIREREAQASAAATDPDARTRNLPAPKPIPVIAMTAHALLRDRERCLAAGMNDYLSKPVDIRSVGEVLDKWLPAESSTPPVAPTAPTPASTPPDSESQTEKLVPPVYCRADFLSRLMGDETALRKVERGFLVDMPVQLATLQALVNFGETRQAGAQAHKIKGAAASISAKALYEAADAVEHAGVAGDQTALELRMAELNRQFELLKAAIPV